MRDRKKIVEWTTLDWWSVYDSLFERDHVGEKERGGKDDEGGINTNFAYPSLYLPSQSLISCLQLKHSDIIND